MNLRDLRLPEIGDTCTGINFERDVDRSGMDCLVERFIEITEHTKGPCGAIWVPGTYAVCLWADGQRGACALHNLELKVSA